jgi:hypothetical protein
MPEFSLVFFCKNMGHFSNNLIMIIAGMPHIFTKKQRRTPAYRANAHWQKIIGAAPPQPSAQRSSASRRILCAEAWSAK